MCKNYKRAVSIILVLSIVFSIMVIPTVNAAGGVLTSDFNGDGRVDFRDYAKLVLNYKTDNQQCDLNNDGIVNMLDLSILISEFSMVIPTEELQRVSFQLKTYVVNESSLTLAGKNIIISIYNSMDLYLADSSYDYRAASEQTKSNYNNLSAQEKVDVKTAIQMWVNTSDLITLQDWFFPEIEIAA